MNARALLTAGVGLLLLSGCTAPRPNISFYGNRITISAAPVGWCEGNLKDGFTSCATTKANRVTLGLHRGESLLVELPSDVAKLPWQVYFRYTDSAHQLHDGLIGLRFDGAVSTVLRPFEASDQLTYAEVQVLPVPIATTGGTGIAYTRTWAVEITPLG